VITLDHVTSIERLLENDELEEYLNETVVVQCKVHVDTLNLCEAEEDKE
jgi:hypothetical protein